jgi:hypothetical protein
MEPTARSIPKADEPPAELSLPATAAVAKATAKKAAITWWVVPRAKLANLPITARSAGLSATTSENVSVETRVDAAMIKMAHAASATPVSSSARRGCCTFLSAGRAGLNSLSRSVASNHPETKRTMLNPATDPSCIENAMFPKPPKENAMVATNSGEVELIGARGCSFTY